MLNNFVLSYGLTVSSNFFSNCLKVFIPLNNLSFGKFNVKLSYSLSDSSLDKPSVILDLFPISTSNSSISNFFYD